MSSKNFVIHKKTRRIIFQKVLDLFVVWRIVIVAPRERPNGRQKGYIMMNPENYSKAITTVQKLREWFPNGTAFTSKDYEERRNMFGRTKIFAFATLRDSWAVRIVDEKHYTIERDVYCCNDMKFEDEDKARYYQRLYARGVEITSMHETIDAVQYIYTVCDLARFLMPYRDDAYNYIDNIDNDIKNLEYKKRQIIPLRNVLEQATKAVK